MRDFDIDSDLKQEKFQNIKLVQGDRGNKIKINVYEDGQPVKLTGCSITAKYKRADGEIINDGVIENIHDNSFDAVMDSSITKVAGTLKMLFTIEKDAVKVSAFLLLADVREGIGESSSSGGSAGGGEVTGDLSDYYKKIETYSRKEIDAQFKEIAKQINENYFILKSQNGTQYKVKVTNNGTLQVVDINEQELEGLLENRLLVWHDEFDGTELDSNKWFKRVRTLGTMSCYFTDRAENSWVENGTLRMKAIRENYNGKTWTSALLMSNELYEPKYGRLEARMKYDNVAGCFPAFWLCGNRFVQKNQQLQGVVWPVSGEVDIMEYYGESKIINNAIFYGNTENSETDVKSQHYNTTYPNINVEEYHTYGLEWTKNSMEFYIDDLKVATFDISNCLLNNGQNPFNYPMYMILQLATESAGGTAPDDLKEINMSIDWVRVYAPKGISELIDVSSVSISQSELNLNVGDIKDLEVSYTPDNCYDHTVHWSSSNPSIATVYGGRVTAISLGKCDIIAKSNNNIQSICKLTVSENSNLVSGITLDRENLELTTENTYTIIPTITPTEATNKTLKYESNNDNVATVDSTGKISAIKEGNTSIKVSSTDGGNIYKTCNVSVINRDSISDNIDINDCTLKLTKKGIYTESPSIWKDDISQKECSFKIAPLVDYNDKYYCIYDEKGNSLMGYKTLSIPNIIDLSTNFTIVVKITTDNDLYNNTTPYSQTILTTKEREDSSNERLMNIKTIGKQVQSIWKNNAGTEQKVISTGLIYGEKNTSYIFVLSKNNNEVKMYLNGAPIGTPINVSSFNYDSKLESIYIGDLSHVYLENVLIYSKGLSSDEVNTLVTNLS